MVSLLIDGILLMQALDMIKDKNILLFMDSHLEGNFSTEEASVIVDLASRCLQYEPKDRPDMKSLVEKLESLQTRSEVCSLQPLPVAPMKVVNSADASICCLY